MGTNVTNISEVTGFTGSGGSNADVWTMTVDLSDPGLTVVTGDFDLDNDTDGIGNGEAPSYSTSGLTSPYGTLSFNTATGAFTFTIDRAAVIASGSDQTVSFTVTGHGSGLLGALGSDTDTVVINLLICVARGTLVATPGGERPVEDLAAGDAVLTADGRAETIRWIGRRHIGAGELARAPDLRPIRIRKDAFGPGQPRRDLLVSPQHRIRVEDARAELLFGEPAVLAPAKGLVNDGSVRVDHRAKEVEYYHIAFDRHEILVTNGLATESFQPGPASLTGIDRDAARELYHIFPALRRDPAAFGPAALPGLRPWEAALLAPRTAAR